MAQDAEDPHSLVWVNMATEDLEEEIRTTEHSLRGLEKDSDEYSALLYKLAIRNMRMWYKTGDTVALDRAIQVSRDTVRATPEDHPKRVSRLYILEDALDDMYTEIKLDKYEEEAHSITQVIVDITPRDHLDRPKWLGFLAQRLWARFHKTGAAKDLDMGIQAAQQAVEEAPKDHPERHIWLNYLGVLLDNRYFRTGAIVDLDNAINFTRKSMESPGDDPEERIIFSNNLAIYLEERYDRTEMEADIDEAIRLSRQTLKDALDGEDTHIMRGACMHSLATSLYNKYSTTGDLIYLEEAVTLSFQAVSVTGEPHTNAAALLNYLAKLLVSRYLETNRPYDLDLGIELSRKVLEMQSSNKLSADQGQYNFQLGFALEQKYTLEEKDIYRKESIFYYQLALCQQNARTFTRIMAGASQIRLHAKAHEWVDAYETAGETVQLISQLTPRSLQNSDKQHALGQVVGLASTAAAMALHAGKGPLAALDFLEQGRGTISDPTPVHPQRRYSKIPTTTPKRHHIQHHTTQSIRS